MLQMNNDSSQSTSFCWRVGVLYIFQFAFSEVHYGLFFFRYKESTHEALGHEIAAAQFIVVNGGAVKFFGRDKWVKKDSTGKYILPRSRVEGLQLEAIDASGTEITSVGFDALCKFIDDWFIFMICSHI